MGLTDFNVLTFDCYGTLIDWETGMIDAIENSSPDPARLWCNAAAENHATLRFSIYKHGRNGASASGWPGDGIAGLEGGPSQPPKVPGTPTSNYPQCSRRNKRSIAFHGAEGRKPSR
jgi:hypothetical protein